MPQVSNHVCWTDLILKFSVFWDPWILSVFLQKYWKFRMCSDINLCVLTAVVEQKEDGNICFLKSSAECLQGTVLGEKRCPLLFVQQAIILTIGIIVGVGQAITEIFSFDSLPRKCTHFTRFCKKKKKSLCNDVIAVTVVLDHCF